MHHPVRRVLYDCSPATVESNQRLLMALSAAFIVDDRAGPPPDSGRAGCRRSGDARPGLPSNRLMRHQSATGFQVVDEQLASLSSTGRFHSRRHQLLRLPFYLPGSILNLYSILTPALLSVLYATVLGRLLHYIAAQDARHHPHPNAGTDNGSDTLLCISDRFTVPGKIRNLLLVVVHRSCLLSLVSLCRGRPVEDGISM